MIPRMVPGLALALLPLCASAQAAKSDAKAAAEPVVRQLEAFRRDDYDTAYAFASEEIQLQFDRLRFEIMVRSGYPEIARSTHASVTGTELRPEGRAYVTVRIVGANGQIIEALYELVWEGAWRINGVATRPATGVI
ncbi:MAG TPA: DUF4864 domain-containing protein [Methylomirabilota bacterium]|jgi:hypothetical protein|nr:DUF4864 domain-containing protein [Methylomirabilota bacterium]